jgi:hypothetical protein
MRRLANMPMKRTKACQLSVNDRRAGAARLITWSKAAARPRQCYYRPPPTAFAAYRQGVELSALARAVGHTTFAATETMLVFERPRMVANLRRPPRPTRPLACPWSAWNATP